MSVRTFTLLAALLCACGPSTADNSEPGNNVVPNGQTGSNNAQTNGQTNGQTSGNNTQTSGNNTQTSGNNTQTSGNNTQTGNNTANNQNPGCALPQAFDVGTTYTTELELDAGADIEAALRAAAPGTRLLLGPGQHAGGISAEGVQGTASAPIALVGMPGAEIVGGASGIQLSNAAYVVFEGFTVRDASANGFNIDDGGDYSTPAHHIVFRNVTVRDIGDGGNQDCVKLSGLDDFHIEGLNLSNCSGQAIDMVGCHSGLITGSDIHDTPGAGVQAKGGTADVTIHRNRFTDVAGRSVNLGGSTGLEFFRPGDAPHEGARVLAYANVFIRPGESAAAYVGCDGCELVNNTIIDPQRWVARVLQETTDARFVPSRNGVFANNIVLFQSSVLRTYVNVGAGTAPETFTFRNNLWWDADNPGFGGPTFSDGIPAGQDGLVADPGVTAGMPTTAVGGPAQGAGADAPAVPDHAGNCFATPPSIGAFEPN